MTQVTQFSEAEINFLTRLEGFSPSDGPIEDLTDSLTFSFKQNEKESKVVLEEFLETFPRWEVVGELSIGEFGLIQVKRV